MYIYIYIHICVCAKLLQSCPTLCNPMDCSLPGSSIHGILQARILEWVVMPSSRGSSQPRDQTCVSCLLHWQAGYLPLVPPGRPTHTHTHTHTHTQWLTLAKLWYKTDLCFISSFSTIFPPTILCLSNWVLQMSLFFGHTTWFAGSHLQYSA